MAARPTTRGTIRISSGRKEPPGRRSAYVGRFGFSTINPNVPGILVPVGNTFANLHVFGATNPGTSQTYTVTLYSGGTTALTCSYTGSAQSCTDTNHFANVNTAGSNVSLQVVTSSGANAADVTATVEFHPFQ